jgi:hypothetical protein
MTPLLGKEGKVLIFNIISFSSSLRRSTPTERRGEVVDFLDTPVGGLHETKMKLFYGEVR